MQIKEFRTPGTQGMVAVGHANCGHIAVLPESVRTELARDLD